MKRIRSTSESFLSFSPTSWPCRLFLSISLFPSLLLFLPYLYFLTSHSRYPLTFTIYSVLFFFLPSTSRTFPKRNELFRTLRFHGVSFTVAQVSRLSQLRFVDVLQLLFGRSWRGTNVTCSFSHLAVVCCVSCPTQISNYNFYLSTLSKIIVNCIAYQLLSRFRYIIIYILLINPCKFLLTILSVQFSGSKKCILHIHPCIYFRHSHLRRITRRIQDTRKCKIAVDWLSLNFAARQTIAWPEGRVFFYQYRAWSSKIDTFSLSLSLSCSHFLHPPLLAFRKSPTLGWTRRRKFVSRSLESPQN